MLLRRTISRMSFIELLLRHHVDTNYRISSFRNYNNLIFCTNNNVITFYRFLSPFHIAAFHA